MSENPTERVVAIGIEAVLIFLAEQIKETVYIAVVNKSIIFTCAEELTEVEGLFILYIL